ENVRKAFDAFNNIKIQTQSFTLIPPDEIKSVETAKENIIEHLYKLICPDRRLKKIKRSAEIPPTWPNEFLETPKFLNYSYLSLRLPSPA
ncbi:MAG: hypothetical protein LBP59_12760, partial [Planctomycetaceae bacterium]|nr:hypothetical protein [Planctomycetaceae bacterium]